MNTIWQQWDLQEKRRLQNLAYINLNNLYLRLERGYDHLTIHSGNTLRALAGQAYDQDDPMRDWWMGEFIKLENWNNI